MPRGKLALLRLNEVGEILENQHVKKSGGSNPLVVPAILFGVMAGLITMGRNASEKHATAPGRRNHGDHRRLSPEIELVGITTVFRDAPRRALLTAEVLKLFGAEVPVVAGCSDPLLPDWSAIGGGRALGRQFEALDPSVDWKGNRHAVPYIIETVRDFHSRGEKITLVPIGPLTNVALAFHLAPDLVSKCDVLLMGGKWSDSSAEWDVRCDPEAAAIFFQSGADIRMVGLDVTLQCVLEDSEVDLIRSSPHASVRFLGQLIDLWGHPVTLHDPLTILALFTDVVGFAPMHLEVTLHPKEQRARTIPVDGPANVRAAVRVNAPEARRIFRDRILGAPRPG